MRFTLKILSLLKFFLLVSLIVSSLLTVVSPVHAQVDEELEEEWTEEFEISPSDLRDLCKLNGGVFQYLPPGAPQDVFREMCGSLSDETPETTTEKPNLDEFLQFVGQGNSPQALAYYQQALAKARETGDLAREKQILSLLGLSYLSQFQYAQALESYEQALAIAKQQGDRQSTGGVLDSIGRLYAIRRQYAKGIEYFEQLLELTQGETQGSIPALRFNALSEIGLLSHYQGKFDKAEAAYTQILAIVQANPNIVERSLLAYRLKSIGKFYTARGQYDRALAVYQKILELSQSSGRLKDYVKLLALKGTGDLAETQGDYSQALATYQQMVALTKQANLRLYLNTSLADVGRIYNRLGKSAEAEKVLWEALRVGELEGSLTAAELEELSEEVSTPSFFNAWNTATFNDRSSPGLYETEKNIYQELQRALIIQNKTNLALEVSERARARAFVELLNVRAALLGKIVPKATIQPITIEQIQQIAREQNATLVQYSIIKQPIQEGVLDYAVEISNPQELEDLQLLIWAIKPSGEVAFRQVDLPKTLTSFEELINASVEGVVKNSRNAILRAVGTRKTAQSLQQLHQLLIEPVADFLPTDPSDRIIFIPDRSLFLVPFVALQDAQGSYLIEKHTILTSPAIRTLELLSQQRQQVTGEGALIVGNPTMPSYVSVLGEKPQQLSSLPNAELEAQEIARLLNSEALIGDRATKKAVLEQIAKVRYIHFATHGLLDDDEGLGSAIALAASAGDNGLLTANELVALKLRAELVVLSACDTGRGVITGDGVIGLSRSLIAAGVPSVVVSLWAVPDASTAFLMTEFYQAMQQTPDKAQALRQAMLTTMKQYPAPRDWAAFTLIGQP